MGSLQGTLGNPCMPPGTGDHRAVYLQLHRFLHSCSDVASAFASRVPNLRCFIHRTKTGILPVRESPHGLLGL